MQKSVKASKVLLVLFHRLIPLQFSNKNMDSLLIGILIFSIASSNLWVGHGQSTFNVLQYGATGDGKTDNSAAFEKAWNAFCGASEDEPILEIPASHTFFLRSTQFKGPCRSTKPHIKILGTLLAPQRGEWGACSKMWLSFLHITGLTVDGTGKIDGQGQAWWIRKPSAQGNDQCSAIPTALLFYNCDGLRVNGLTHVNGPGSHLYVVHSKNVELSHLTITSPKDSHNTDGIDLGNAINVNIHDSVIGTGDDCIAVKGNSKFINITHVTCGPGHGISMGSLGSHGQEDKLENVKVQNCHFNGAESATKIKTWPGGKGYAKGISFEHITLNQTRNPVFIDQHYMHNPEQPGAVKVSDVTFSDIQGTCLDKGAIILDCAKIGCTNIKLNQIKISSINPTQPASVICNNAHGTSQNTSPPVPCLSNSY